MPCVQYFPFCLLVWGCGVPIMTTWRACSFLFYGGLRAGGRFVRLVADGGFCFLRGVFFVRSRLWFSDFERGVTFGERTALK